MVRRSLFDTLRMLRREGIEVDARLVGTDVVVCMAFPIPAGTQGDRKFRRNDLNRAANELGAAALTREATELVAAAITLYPSSALAQVNEVISSAVAATKPRV